MPSSERALTIGLPVYNGAKVVGSAIESLLAQTHADFTLRISDNASTDDTEAICRDYAQRHERIEYVRQPENLGAMPNFGFLLASATTRYFMWAACDDHWQPTFVARNLAALEASDRGVCSVSRVAFMEGSRVELIGATAPLDGTPAENLVRYLGAPETNSRFYGIHRTEVLQRCFRADDTYVASDWVVMARTLRFGTHLEVPELLMRRGVQGDSSNAVRLVLSTNPSWLSRWWLPMWPMTRRVLAEHGGYLLREDPAKLRALVAVLWSENRRWTRGHRRSLRHRRRAERKRKA
ncbi:MAG: glycosyltransferase family A protein [Myxococcota bacterium]